ncbi:MAG TPA: hypothetical protein VH062_15730 [Polyangiaceae bacterium]|jgi:hypothetical protein|nr:hypothetical protein [Polyangiaceae bacterium]
MKATLSRLLQATALFVVGCGPPIEPDGTPGALRAGGFVYCDPANHCGYSDPLPDGIAVGSVFELMFDDGDSGIVLSSANDDRLQTVTEQAPEGDATQFRAILPGPATVEARDSVDGELIDTITLALKSVVSLGSETCARSFNVIEDASYVFDPFDCAGTTIGTSGVTISRGSSLAPTVCVMPLGDSGTVLSGLLSGTFAASGDAQLEIHVDAEGRCATIGGLTLGDAKVKMTTGELDSTFTVRVVP